MGDLLEPAVSVGRILSRRRPLPRLRSERRNHHRRPAHHFHRLRRRDRSVPRGERFHLQPLSVAAAADVVLLASVVRPCAAVSAPLWRSLGLPRPLQVVSGLVISARSYLFG